MTARNKNNEPVTKVAYAVSIALAGSYAPGVLAQTQTVGLEQIVVTARKREETLIDVPQEIQAIGQQQLERANVSNLDDLTRFVPSLSFNAITPGRGAIYFRGVADDSSSFIADASAAIYLDEQPLTQSSLQPEIRLIDIERIEALPGPQGTLYGSSSQAGTLRYITNKPDPGGFESTFSADANSVDDGDYGYEVSAVLNLPVTDDMAIRLVGFTARDAGFIDNVLGTSLGGTFTNADVVDDDINAVDYAGGRVALRWLPDDNWTVDASVVFQSMDGNSYSAADVFTDDYNQHPELEGRELAVVLFQDESRSDEWAQLSLTLQGDLGWGQVTSATSYFTREIEYHQDNTDYTFYLSHSEYFGATYPAYDLGPDPRGLGWSDDPDVQRFAQEFRLQGATDRMTWLAGVFYERVHDGFNFFTRVEDYEDTVAFETRSYYAAYYGVDLKPGSTDNAFYHSRNDLITEQYAAFGELGFSLSDRLTLTTGLRWFDHTRKRDYFIQQPNGYTAAELPAVENSTSDITKKISLQYRINDNAMVYGLFSDGFRAGGRNVVRPGTVLPADYDPDFLDNYELGFKSRWLDDRVVFNLTAFRMEWKDYQIEVTDPGPSFAVLVANVGDAEIDGISTEFSARLWDSFDIGLNAQFIDPTTKADDLDLELESGQRLPFSPREKGAVWLEYTFPGQLLGASPYGRFQWTYHGNSLNGIGDATLQPSYEIADFKIGLEAEDWEVYAYVDNISNERAIIFDQFAEEFFAVGLRTNNLKTVSVPRTWGIGFAKRWGRN
jgi:outer membrane receptor protein involved in Fe transport